MQLLFLVTIHVRSHPVIVSEKAVAALTIHIPALSHLLSTFILPYLFQPINLSMFPISSLKIPYHQVDELSRQQPPDGGEGEKQG